MTIWNGLLVTLSYLLICYAECEIKHCNRLRDLECALFTKNSNEKRLNQAFFPPRKATSRYIRVDYVFNTTELDKVDGDKCSVTYIWSIGGFLLIQPPSIFQLTSLMFNYPANDIATVTLELPLECIHVINANRTCSCAHLEDNKLDILTQQMLQYSKYSNPEGLVRDVTSTAQALCIEDIEQGHFRHTNVTVYIIAKLTMPVAMSVASVTALSKYHSVLTEKVINPSDRQNFVGITMASIYIFLYIVSVDAAAITYYVANKTEYGPYPKIAHSISLQLTYITLILECLLSVFALIGIVLCHQYTSRYEHKWNKHSFVTVMVMFLMTLYIPFILLLTLGTTTTTITITSFLVVCLLCSCILCISVYLKMPIEFYLIWFIVVPIAFVSSHIDYIMVAWLTEPEKTTSASILALVLMFYLFSLTRFLYSFFTGILNSEYLKLLLTFLFGLFGVGMTALQIAAFYLLPIPSIKLADYLDNFFQISLVILAGLITYKVISGQESDLMKFFKKFSNTYEPNNGNKRKAIISKPVPISAEIIAAIKCENNTIVASKEDTILVVTIPQHEESKKLVISLSHVHLEARSQKTDRNQWQVFLETARIFFKLFSTSNIRVCDCSTDLKDSEISIRDTVSANTNNNNKYSVTSLECFVSNDNENSFELYKNSLYHDSCDIISTEGKLVLLHIPIQSYIVSDEFPSIGKGASCRFHNSVSMHTDNEGSGSTAITVNADRILLPVGTITYIKNTISEQDQTISIKVKNSQLDIRSSLDNTVTLTRHSRCVWLKSVILPDNNVIQIKSFTDDGTKYVFFQSNLHTLKIPLAHLQCGFVSTTLKVDSRENNSALEFDNHTYCQHLRISSGVHSLNFSGNEESNDVIIHLISPTGISTDLVSCPDMYSLQIINAQTVAMVFINKILSDVKLKSEDQVLTVSLKYRDKKTLITTPIQQDMYNLMLHIGDNDEHPPVSLFFPFNNKETYSTNEFERAGFNLGHLAQLLAPTRQHE